MKNIKMHNKLSIKISRDFKVIVQVFLISHILSIYEVVLVIKSAIAKLYMLICLIPAKTYNSTRSSTETNREFTRIFPCFPSPLKIEYVEAAAKVMGAQIELEIIKLPKSFLLKNNRPKLLGMQRHIIIVAMPM